jgi:putative lipoic acid-binding regulatory protein
MDSTSEEFYQRLKNELETSTEWPSEYLFKFIVPTSQEKIIKVEDAFNQMGAVIETKQSKTGKYTSVSVNVKMESAQAVIDKYVQLSTIEGIISL